jgi:spore coat protein U-like protein
MMRGIVVATLLSSLLLVGERAAYATTSCAFSGIVGVAFGPYDPFTSSPLDSTGSMTLRCENVGPSDTVIIDLGRGSATSYTSRAMHSGIDVLQYNLYLDAARTAIWGDGTGGSSHYGPFQPPSGSDLTLSVYGRIPARQNVRAGSYTDTITVTIYY